MMKSLKTVALAATAVASMSFGAANAAVVFDDGATDFTGSYRGVETLNVNFFAPAGPTAISFDLFGASSIDGQGNGWDDVFTIALNGIDVFVGQFSMSGGGNNVVGTNTFGWTVNTVTNPGGLFEGGVTSVAGLITLIAGLNTFAVTFSAPGANNGGGQPLSDESWALNDLTVAAVPVPAALPLLLVGLGALGALRSRKRKSSAV